MIKFLFLTLTLSVLSKGAAQNNDSIVYTTVIAGKAVSFKQTNSWTLSSTDTDKKIGKVFLTYTHKPIRLASNKKQIIPTESCIVETVSGYTDIKNYSLKNLAFFKKQPSFRIQKIITHDDGLITIPYAIGYWATYSDNSETIHTIIIIHALNNRGKGLQFLIDCPEEGFSDMEIEITDILRSLHFIL